MAESEDPPGNARWDLSPGWVADGSGFVGNLRAAGPAAGSSVWMVGVSGAPRQLRDGAEALSVSPDGSSIAFTPDAIEHTYRNLWLMDHNGQNARQLFSADPGHSMKDLSWSPDGSRVAYLRADDTGRRVAIETRPVAGGPASLIARGGESEIFQGVAWLRDGRLLYSLRHTDVRHERGNGAVHALADAGRQPQRRAARSAETPRRLAASMRRSAQLQCRRQAGLFLQWALQDAIHVADVDAGGQRPP